MIDLIRLFRCLTPWRDNFVYQSSRQVAACLRELGCGAGVPRSGGKQSARGPRVYRSILRTIPAGGRPASPGGIMRMLLPILVGILTVACGDGDTSVSSPVEPTPPPPTPPLTATMAPSSGAVVVGNSVVFAVNTSGGATGESASWTCASSNPGIATASNTTAGCQATGVAAGDVTITATVTKGGESINVASQLTVTPPRPPPLTATMTPSSVVVVVGGSIIFAVNTSGGATGESASWTCASSNPGIATASNTTAGCQATGVAAGDVTITATVTKGGESINVASQLTVTLGDLAFIFVTSITDETPNDNTLSGTVSVRVSVERGDQRLEGLSLLVDEDEVACLSFSGGICSSRRDGHLLHRRLMPQQTAQAVHSFTLTFDSSGYNGYHTISAQLYIRGADEAVSSGVHSVEFANMPDPPDPPPAAVGTRANPAAVGDTIKYETDFFHFDGVGTLEITLRGVAEGDSAMAIIERDFSDVRNIAGTHYVYVVADFRIKVLEQTNPDRPITIPLSWPNWTSWSGDTWYPYPYVITAGGGKPVATGTEWAARVPLIFHRERSTVLDDLAAYQYHPEAERRRGPDHGAWFIIRERLAP